MREKKRYILLEAEGVQNDERALKDAAYEAVFEWLGEKGVSEARVQFVRAEITPGAGEPAIAGKKASFWLKCATSALEPVLAALALKRFYQQKDVALRAVKVAGSVPRVGPPRGKKPSGRTQAAGKTSA